MRAPSKMATSRVMTPSSKKFGTTSVCLRSGNREDFRRKRHQTKHLVFRLPCLQSRCSPS